MKYDQFIIMVAVVVYLPSDVIDPSYFFTTTTQLNLIIPVAWAWVIVTAKTGLSENCILLN